MTLTGTVRDFNMFSIFSLINSQNKIGTLTVDDTDTTKVRIYFDQGYIIGVSSDIHQSEDSVASMLLRGNKISSEELQNIIQEQTIRLKPIEDITLESGLITLQDMQEIIQMKAMKTIYRVFSLTTASYQFESIISDITDTEKFTPISIESALMEAARFLDEWPHIQKRLPDYSQLLARSLTAETALQTISGLQTASDENTAFLDDSYVITYEEETILRYFDQPTSINTILKISKYLELSTCKLVVDLLEKGLLVIHHQTIAEESPILQQFADIQHRQQNTNKKSSVLFWPFTALFILIPAITYLPKINRTYISSISSIKCQHPEPVNNRQTEERAAFAYLLNNVQVKDDNILLFSEIPQNVVLNKYVYNFVHAQAVDLFKQYQSDPLLPLFFDGPAKITEN